uniref:Anaphase-promoting complex subunit 4 n=1 Tax=Hirondellea gigas TaxID=1518452 RepID=A0A2P2I5C2_9CRUS
MMAGVIPANQMKQVLEKHLSICITKCVWSPKMDLLLTANSYGHVTLQRHRSLQRVWQLVPSTEHTVVTGLAWRPDSNLVAIGYKSGLVTLVTLETGTEVHSFEAPEGVSSLAWQQHCKTASQGEADIWSNYMTPLPASDKWFSESSNTETNTASGGAGSSSNTSDPLSWQNSHILDNQDSLTLLIVGTEKGKVLLCAFGLVHCATIDLADKVPGLGKVLDAQCSHNMNLLSVVVEARDEITCSGEEESVRNVLHVACDMSVIAEHHRELYDLAKKYSEIQALFNYSTEAISQLREAWEGILLEMDTKLDAYFGMREAGEVSTDFLELLMFGRTPPELNMFLSTKLTEKGLKKLRQTVELNYTNMHKLVVKQLEAVGQGLTFVLSQVLGMARTQDRFGLLGVDEDVVNASFKEAGAFLLKTTELQAAIRLSMRDFLAFLKWLSVVHLRITGNQVPPELAKTTHEETQHIVNFLSDTLEEVVIDKDGKRHRKFRLEGVGQYLQDENLKKPPKCDNNPWIKFLDENPKMKDLPMILPQRRETSLIQEYSRLSEELIRLAKRSVDVISKNINVANGVIIFKHSQKSEVSISQSTNPDTQEMNVILVPSIKSPIFYFGKWTTDINDMYLRIKSFELSSTLNIALFRFTPTNCLSTSSLASPSKTTEVEHEEVSEAPIIAAQFYNGSMASVLVQDFGNVMRSLLIQVPVVLLEANVRSVGIPENCSVADANLDSVDLSKDVTRDSVCRLDVSAGLFGVSGARKLAVVVANHRRTVQLYDMEADEDDYDDDNSDDGAVNSSVVAATALAADVSTDQSLLG